MENNIGREELVNLIKRILSAPGSGVSDEELDSWVVQLQRSVPHPRVSDLIYWPNLCGFDRDLTPEEIADIALNYSPTSGDQP